VSTGLARTHPAWLIATFFGVGRLPGAPGTWGSLAALPLAWLFLDHLGPAWLIGAAAIVFLAGWWASEQYVRASGETDPGAIVIDEVAGMFVALAVAPPDLLYVVAGFALFRIADIWKPWPVSWAERTFKGGLGVMADDILAGIYAMIALAVIMALTG